MDFCVFVNEDIVDFLIISCYCCFVIVRVIVDYCWYCIAAM